MEATATRFDRRLIAPMILGAICNPINSSIIAVSLIPIGKALGASPSQTAWLVSGLYLATSIGQPVVGRLVDLYGPRRLYLIGTALVGIAGVIGTLAPSLGVLIAARIILGFGTCAGYPAAMYLIRSEAKRTGQDSPAGILTALAVASQTIVVIGPSLGGLLILVSGWRATFAINVPLSIACLVLGSLRLPRQTVLQEDRPKEPRPSIDPLGIALFSAMLISFLLFLMDPHVADTYLLAITIAATAAFVMRERSTTDPFIDVRVLGGNLPLVATYVRTLLTCTVSYAFLYGFTQWLEDGRGLTAAHAGLMLLPMPAIAIMVSATTGRRPQIRGKLVVGATAQLVVCAMLFLLGASSAIWLILVAIALLGLPQGLNSLANQNAVYHQADAERIASSAGLLRTFTYLGAIGASAASGLFLQDGATTGGLHHLAIFMLVAAALFLILTLADRSLGRVGQPQQLAEVPRA